MIARDMVAPERRRPLRRAEYDRLIEAEVFGDERLELLYGHLVAMSPQSARHSYPIRQLDEILQRALREQAKVQVQMPLALSDDSEPEPDLAVIPLGDYREAQPTTALFVVEVADSSLDDDRLVKGRLYAECGIPEYWIVNVRDMRVERYLAPSQGVYTRLSTHGPEESLSLHAFADVLVPLADVLPIKR